MSSVALLVGCSFCVVHGRTPQTGRNKQVSLNRLGTFLLSHFRPLPPMHISSARGSRSRSLPSMWSMQESVGELSGGQQVANGIGHMEEIEFSFSGPEDSQTIPLVMPAVSGINLKETEWTSLTSGFYADLQVPMRKAVERLGEAQFKIVLAHGNRRFGEFQEKTILANPAAKVAITNVCRNRNFIPAWSDVNEDEEGGCRMTKIPIIVLTRLLSELGEAQEDVTDAFRGAYPIAMDPQYSTCMNVIVGKRPNGAVEKFSLYYTDPVQEDTAIPLWQGFSLRTGAFTDKHIMNRNHLQQASDFIGVDGPEDALFVKAPGSSTDKNSMLNAFEQTLEFLEGNGDIELVNSYDPDSEITAAREEFELVKAYC